MSKTIVSAVGDDWTVNQETGQTTVKATHRAGEDRVAVEIARKGDQGKFADDLSATELLEMATYLTDIAERLDATQRRPGA